MTAIVAGFSAQKRIYESENSLVYRARQEERQRAVILKVLKHPYPSPEKVAWFTREYELTRSLHLKGVIRAYDFTTDQYRPVMVLEDFGGESLEFHLKTRPHGLSLAEFFPLAIRVAGILEAVHQAGVVHKDVNPSNIVWNPHTDQVKLIDFGSSTMLLREQPDVRSFTSGEGTLAYISPEQTGRMNRDVDYRTDFYSLGVSFYELLIGRLPFITSDPLEIMHAHLAKRPSVPHELAPSISSFLSAIVMKLMAKNAEDRYQSARGLREDLEECSRRWRVNENVENFLLGVTDRTERLAIPQKLYGREVETAVLMAAFARVSNGSGEMLLVSGHAGIGKSALIREIYKPITQRRGYVLTGKFDQFNRDTPYASLGQAFRSFVRQLLTEDGDQIFRWRERLMSALEPNGQVILNIIPELALIIGPQPPPPPLPPTEALNRLHFAFLGLLQVFAQLEHPLVLCLDDLQWADGASLNLLRLLLTRGEHRYFLVIGAYRDNEVHDAHPLKLTLEEIRKTNYLVHDIVLPPLQLSTVCQLISEALNTTEEKGRPLAELIVAKTGGVPFFMNEFLKALYSEHLLTFNPSLGQWCWEIARIQARNITENVVELVREKLQRLEQETQQVLQRAACLGNQFDFHTLSMVCGQSPQRVAAALERAAEEGVIIPLSKTYKLMSLPVPKLMEEVHVDYKFAHDRVQQAAYASIPEVEKPLFHWGIGQSLLKHASPSENEVKTFTIVNHLNLGQELFRTQTEREQLAEWNLVAGRKAKVSAAFAPAYHYLQTGLKLLGAEIWERQYSLALNLHIETAEAAYLNADFGRMEQLIELECQHAHDPLDMVKAYEVRLAAYSIQNRQKDGIKTGLHILNLLQITLPEKPTQADVVRELERTQLALSGMPVEDLLNLPEMTDPYRAAAVRILFNMVHHSYSGAPELFPLIVFRIVTLSAEYGNVRHSALGYATYGLLLCGMVGDADTGYRFGLLAQQLVERMDAKELNSSILFVVSGFVRHWKDHLRETLLPLREAYRIGLETGDLSIGTQAAFVHSFHSYWMGRVLPELDIDLEKYGAAFKRLKQEHMVGLNTLYRQVVVNLCEQTNVERRCSLVGRYYDETTIIPLLTKENNANALAQVYLNKLILCYLFADHAENLDLIASTEKYLPALAGTPAVPVFYFYDSLTRITLLLSEQGSNRVAFLTRVAENQEKLRLWAHHAPMNYLHKFYLVEAERARVLGNDGEAREFYDKAITLAHENEYLNEEALAYELAGRFHLDRGQAHLARYYLRDAHYAYLRWGALAKVKDLETRYPQIFPSTATTEQPTSSDLDAQSLLKASQALTGEIVLDKLLARLMRIVLENAGAQRGVLLFVRNGQLVIEAEGRSEQEEVPVLHSVPVETRDDLPISLFRYVERTKERVVLNDAAEAPTFAADPYIINKRPKSALCTPLIKQDQLTGILYLENNLTTGVFTPDKLEVVNVLATEAAISIENARLYRSLEEANEQLADYSKTLEVKVEERTQDLQQKNQELEEASQQVNEANRRKSRFLAGMSHQLRTPMNAILGFTRLVLRRAGDILPERQRDNLVKVRESAENLLSLINQLLDLSKIEAGRMEIHPALFDVKKFIVGCVETITPLVKPGVLLRSEVVDRIDNANTDEDGLRQIVLNLLSNAVKFTEVGEVVVRASREERENSETWLVISVIDTGPGIAADALERIFDEFEQLGQSNLHGEKRGSWLATGVRRLTDLQEGTGLGLPIAQRWAELLGGSISVQSELGKGSTFTVSIPMIYRTSQGALVENRVL